MIMKQIHFSVEESYSERIFFLFFYLFFFLLCKKIGSNILFGAFRGSLKDISKRSKKKNCWQFFRQNRSCDTWNWLMRLFGKSQHFLGLLFFEFIQYLPL